MELTTEQIGDIRLVTVNDTTLDASNTPDFRAAMAPILRLRAKVVLDISRLTFVDSSGLGAILSCLRTLNAAGGDLRLLCGISKPIRMFFELVRMNGIIEIHNTRQEAIASFGAVVHN